MIPFFLITGFLGSGKTTLLKNILREYAGTRRIAIIQNEFAATSTDGKELELTGTRFRLVELNNGSVFCVCMLGNFASSVAGVIDEYSPEMIFLESSGLSDPINILELLQDELIREKVHLSEIITVVDVQNFDRALKLLTRSRHQVMIADRVLINKTDLFPDGVKEVQKSIEAINPFAVVVLTSYCRLDQEQYLPGIIEEHHAAGLFGKRVSEGRPDLNASVLRINRKISPEGIGAFVDGLQETCPRIKGYVNSLDGNVYMIQSVFDSFEKYVVEGYAGPSEIIAFGRDLTPRMLREKFLQYC
jgi:G3E family GTPase